MDCSFCAQGGAVGLGYITLSGRNMDCSFCAQGGAVGLGYIALSGRKWIVFFVPKAAPLGWVILPFQGENGFMVYDFFFQSINFNKQQNETTNLIPNLPCHCGNPRKRATAITP